MDGKRKVGRPNIRWIDGVERDIKVLRVQGWKSKAVDRDEWRKIIPAIGCSTHNDDDDIFTRSVLMYACETWALIQYEKKMQKMIYGPVQSNGKGRIIFNHELYL
ncbi:hypothetical protein C0J52_26202 [Blattella germanica]|nr:hypothetical protein C0J52_26202 [Blattella germanica]